MIPSRSPFRPFPDRRAAAVALAALLNIAAGVGLAKWTRGATPPLKLADARGKVHDLAALRGKTVVVNFWATWCEPCRDEMPSLDRLRAHLQASGAQVWAVNAGESAERVARFTRDVPVAFPILFDQDGSVAKRWGVRGYPTTFVVGPDGRIRYYFVGEFDWSREDVAGTIAGIR